jgi:hypothetical protein
MQARRDPAVRGDVGWIVGFLPVEVVGMLDVIWSSLVKI